VSTPLLSALEHVDLEAGRTYHCRVRDLWVEMRVSRAPADLLPDELDGNDIMLDSPADLPGPEPSFPVRSRPGHAPLPDEPQIPTGDCTRSP